MHLPARFGKYELQEFLGGGMSHVYRAVDTVIGRPVAVKILTGDAARDIEAKERFLHEARISGAIQHDHIVTIHDYGEEQGLPYIVMEYLRGGDLRDAMRKGQAGDILNRLRIASEAAAAMEYVHSRGVIHRDIKPENIFLEESGRSKIMDFGISKAAGFNLTKAGNTMGTPFYMSPEQVMGVNITPLVDVYSYGILMYELFTGERLVSGDSMERLFYVILHENPDPAKLHAAGLPPALSDMILRCTAKKPEERMQGFGQVRQILAKVIADLRGGVVAKPVAPVAPVPPTPVAKPAPSGPNMGLIAGAIAGLVVLGGIGFYVMSGSKTGSGPGTETLGPAATLSGKGGSMVLIPA